MLFMLPSGLVPMVPRLVPSAPSAMPTVSMGSASETVLYDLTCHVPGSRSGAYSMPARTPPFGTSLARVNW